MHEQSDMNRIIEKIMLYHQNNDLHDKFRERERLEKMTYAELEKELEHQQRYNT